MFGPGGILAVIFMVLKLCYVIDWSWWWVLCPFWAPVALGMACKVVGRALQSYGH
jgi:hypothetical protein